MLDVPFARSGLAFDGAPPSVRGQTRSGQFWQPKLYLVPAWRLDAKARLWKRLLDIAAATAGLVVLAIPMLLLMLLIRMESPGPVLFRQRRVGLLGNSFILLKLRTMYHRPDMDATLRQATRADPRVTRIGRWLRRYSIDEIPQLINVLRGEMSLVGPRPHAPGTRAGDRLFEDVTHRYDARHCVKPGMTGLAQVRGWRGETDTEEKLLLRVESDLEYIATWSLRLDLVIIWRTAGSVLGMRNAW